MKNIEDDYYSLIIKYLKGDSSQQVKNKFFEWLDDDPENKKIFFELKSVHDKYTDQNNPIDIRSSWEILHKKYKRQNRRFVKILFRAASYAATVALAVVLTTLLMKSSVSEEETIKYGSYQTGGGSVVDKITLPDGTMVFLGAQTTFHCGDNFGKSDRIVYLSGEALFEVSHMQDKPFRVISDNHTIEVLGTKFNVMSYPYDSIVVTTLLEGAVKLKAGDAEEFSTLEPDDQMTFNKITGKKSVKKVDSSKIAGWSEGYYYFEEQTLDEILHRLGNVYGMNFDIRLPLHQNKKFTGTFHKEQNIKEILDVIKISFPIRYSINKRNVIIYSK